MTPRRTQDRRAAKGTRLIARVFRRNPPAVTLLIIVHDQMSGRAMSYKLEFEAWPAVRKLEHEFAAELREWYRWH